MLFRLLGSGDIIFPPALRLSGMSKNSLPFLSLFVSLDLKEAILRASPLPDY